jgi:hypothetical protein
MPDLTTLIVDLLRKKEEDKAVHAGESMTPEQAMAVLQAQATPMQPSPDVLGSGMAQRAGSQIAGRDKQIMDMVNAAQ